MTRPRHPADALAGLIFLAIPLLASPWFWDQFTTLKWYALQALAALWLLAERFWGGPWRWPAWVVRARVPLLLLAGLALVNLGRSGWGFSLTPLVERASVLALAFCAFRYARRRREPLRWPALGTSVAALVNNALGTAQILGARPLPALTAGDGRSALFGNVNMAAQFLGWAFVLLLLARPRRGARLFWEALLAWTAAHLYFLSCRSVLIGVGLALVLLLVMRRASRWSLVRVGAGAALLVALLLGSGAPAQYLGDARRHKGLGAAQRLDLWQATLALAADHPLGVGPSNFTHAFPPYHLASDLPRDEAIEYRHPHNELLRVVAEEGWAFTAVALVLAAWLLAALAGRSRVRRGRTRTGAFVVAMGAYLAVEAAFQFPLGVAFGALAFAWWLGMALASLEPDGEPPETGRRAPVATAVTALISLGILAGTARTAWSEYLFVNRAYDAAAQAMACRLEPRNLSACVSAAWLEDAKGDHAAARARLLAVLARSPHYGPPLKLLGEITLSSGEAETACFYLWLYDGLYRGHSATHAHLTSSCRPEWLATFAREQPMPYRAPFPRRGSDR